MTKLRHPAHDSLPPSDPVYQDIPLGPGQEGGLTQEGDLQWTPDGDPLRGTDVRRTPGRDTAIVVHRPPEWPA